MIRNPYKKLQTNAPNIKQFCKPIYTPRSTVRNPYARDSKVEEQKQAISLSVLTPKPFLKTAVETVTQGGAHDTSSSVAPTAHDQNGLFHIDTGSRVSFFSYYILWWKILHNVTNTYFLTNVRFFTLEEITHHKATKVKMWGQLGIAIHIVSRRHTRMFKSQERYSDSV